jgi:cell wall-associated NlpC family hydrolase
MQQTLFNQPMTQKARKFSPSFLLAFKSIKKTLLIFGTCGILSACAIFPRFSSLPDFDKEVSAGTEDISIAAIGLVGVPYRYGGNTPKGGFDCSGLIGYVYQHTANKKLPRTTEEIGQIGISLGNNTPAPGDLVFFNTQGGRHSHVGIYVGKGRFVHAPSKGGTVRLEKITSSYWSQRYTEARRIIQK